MPKMTELKAQLRKATAAYAAAVSAAQTAVPKAGSKPPPPTP